MIILYCIHLCLSLSLSLSYAEWFINTGGDLVQKEHWFGRSARQEETVQAIGTDQYEQLKNKPQNTILPSDLMKEHSETSFNKLCVKSLL